MEFFETSFHFSLSSSLETVPLIPSLSLELFVNNSRTSYREGRGESVLVTGECKIKLLSMDFFFPVVRKPHEEGSGDQ